MINKVNNNVSIAAKIGWGWLTIFYMYSYSRINIFVSFLKYLGQTDIISYRNSKLFHSALYFCVFWSIYIDQNSFFRIILLIRESSKKWIFGNSQIRWSQNSGTVQVWRILSWFGLCGTARSYSLLEHSSKVYTKVYYYSSMFVEKPHPLSSYRVKGS